MPSPLRASRGKFWELSGYYRAARGYARMGRVPAFFDTLVHGWSSQPETPPLRTTDGQAPVSFVVIDEVHVHGIDAIERLGDAIAVARRR